MNTYNDYWVNNYLSHYGVLGMRWGTRNIRSAATGKRKIGWDEDVVIKKRFFSIQSVSKQERGWRH